jgi:hypothetical protein
LIGWTACPESRFIGIEGASSIGPSDLLDVLTARCTAVLVGAEADKLNPFLTLLCSA